MTAVFGAVVFFMLLASIGEVGQVVDPRGHPSAVPGVAQGLVEVMEKHGPASIAGAFLLASALAGLLTGLFARRLRPILRSLILALATLPALSLGIAGMWAVVMSKEVLPDAMSGVWMPLGAGLYISLIIIELAPVLLGPAILGAVVLEGWTRPETLPQTGLARPATRRWVLRGLLAIAAAPTTFAVLNWRRVPPSR